MLTHDQLVELESKYGRIARVTGKPYPKLTDEPNAKPAPSYEVVLRKPTRAEYKAFRARSHNPQQVADAQEILARACVVYPSKEAFDALLEDYPAIPEAASNAISALVGMAVDESEK